LLDSLEESGGRVVLDGTEAGERSLWRSTPAGIGSEPGSPAPSAQSSLDELARAYCTHCTDVFQRPNTRLYDWLEHRVTERGVRGILLWHYVGCDLWRAEAASLREALELPVLGLDADETGSDFPRTIGRIEAFIESLSTV
jgi:benzoyl-CoA reductase/2-hydroxyglutaryl-CoA dehydratase subunit BcrC/BadD/HgdB